MPYTLVQHSAFGYGGDPAFRRAIEERTTTAEEQKTVEKSGGLLYPTYAAASEAAMEINYPPGYGGFLAPRVNGSFSPTKIDDLAIYLPAPNEWGRREQITHE